MCSIKAPLPVDSISASYSKPILVVKYLGQIEAYATYRNGAYEFNLNTDIADAIDSGQIEARFHFDDDIPIGIQLAEA